MASLDGNCLLKIVDSEELTEFLHVCVDDLIGNAKENFDNYNSDIEWTKDEYEKAQKLIQNIFKTNILSNNDTLSLNINNLSKKAENAIQDCYRIRRPEILQYLVKLNLIKKGHPLVENIDWKLKWVLGSSRLASIGEPYLEFDFHCLHGENAGRKTVNFEMNLEQVDKLVTELERVQTELKS